jgi:eukaryotic-like serine/threonine-protein kinase
MGRSIMAASTSHTAMARVLEFGELDAGRPFTVTEFVEGRRLSEMLAGHTPLEVHAALRLALELGGAVETLHNMGFIHGAISPRNVMVLEDGRVKLLDIELAGLRDAREVQGLVNVDSPAEYLAPEQLQKAPTTEKTDIYAYGVILHELLSGAPPFQGSTREAIVAKHLKEAPAPIRRERDGVPASVSRAVTLALYKQPEARPLMGDVLNLLWTGAHGPVPKRTRAVTIAGGSALAVLAIGAVVWGALALRTPTGSVPAQPTARPAIESPVPTPPAETRKPTAPPAHTPRETGRATVTETPPPTVRAPEPTAPTARPGAPAVPTPPVERAPAAPRPPATAAPPDVRPTPDVRPAPDVRPTPPVRATTPPAPSVAPPAAPAAPPTPAVTTPARPAAPPSQATAPAAPRAERRETPQTPQTPSAPQQPTPSTETEDTRAVIDWLLNPRGQ